MSDDLTDTLRRALEDLMTEARAKEPGRGMTEADRDAVLWVTDREEGPPVDWSDRPTWRENPRLRIQ